MPQLKETKEELGLLNLIQQFLDTVTPGGYVLLAQTAPGEGPGTSRTALVCNLPPADAVELMEEFSKQFRESLSQQQAVAAELTEPQDAPAEPEAELTEPQDAPAEPEEAPEAT